MKSDNLAQKLKEIKSNLVVLQKNISNSLLNIHMKIEQIEKEAEHEN
jgi:hypothetical protein